MRTENDNVLDVFIGRQPITNAALNLYGYELLFRSGPRNEFGNKDAVEATSEVVNNTVFSLCQNRLTRDTKAFVNLPKEFLLADRLQVVSPDILVLEILETVEPDSAVLSACKLWKDKGYLLALDDFSPDYYSSPLTKLVDIIKVDFRATTARDQAVIVSRYCRTGVQFLAEKVETQEEFERARRLGYSFFQGYFFAKPTITPDKQVPGLKIQYLKILEEVNRAELNTERIGKLISEDVSLTCKLLTFINSAAFTFRGTVRSIKQALILLGEDGTRRWVALAALVAMTVDRPGELLINALVRAKFSEALAKVVGVPERSGEFFLMGMLSRVDAILGVPIAKVLANITLSDDVQKALIESGNAGVTAMVLEIVRLYEAAEWNELERRVRGQRLDHAEVAAANFSALLWADQIISGSIAEDHGGNSHT